MHSPIRALLWERWRRTWWTVLLAIVCMALVGAIMGGKGDEEGIILLTSPPLLLLFGVLILGHCGRDQLDGTYPRRLLRLPLSTVTLTAVHMAYGAAVVGLSCAILLGTAYLCEGATPHLMRFAALVFVAYFVFQTLAWIEGPYALGACAFGLLTPLAIGVGMYLLRDAVLMRPMGFCVFCLAVITACLAVSVWVISRDRCGTKGAVLDWLRPRLPDLRGRTEPFASAGAAQVWYEGRLMGRRLPLYAAASMVFLIGLGLLLRNAGTFFDDPSLFPGVPTLQVWVIPLLLPILVFGAWFASLGRFATYHNERVSGRWNFVIARPMSTSALASCRLRAGLHSILSAFTMVGLACTVLVLWAWAEGRLDDFGVLADSFGVWPSASAVALACLSVFAAAAVAVWTFFWMGPEILGLFVAAGLLSFLVESSPVLDEALLGFGWLLGVVLAAVTIKAYRTACARGLVPKKTIGVVAVATAILALASLSLSLWLGILDPGTAGALQYLWMAVAATALALLPRAYVPLMMAGQRHR
jgi:hypothetical protein